MEADTERKSSEDAALLAFMMEEETMDQGCRPPLDTGRARKEGLHWSLQKEPAVLRPWLQLSGTDSRFWASTTARG